MRCDHTKAESWIAYDARGIPLGRVCAKCEKAKLGTYRPEVLTDPNYETDERIEPDPEMYPGGAAHRDVMGYNDDAPEPPETFSPEDFDRGMGLTPGGDNAHKRR